jgi:hypothetical protein
MPRRVSGKTATIICFDKSLSSLGLGLMLDLDVYGLFESAFLTSRSNQAKTAKDLLPALSAFSAFPCAINTQQVSTPPPLS